MVHDIETKTTEINAGSAPADDATTTQNVGGRPHGQQPRPHIQVPGDELWPVRDLAADFGTCERTVKRLPGIAITYIGNVAYAKNLATRRLLADRAKPKKRRRGRP
jgi:hypothetical protein